MHNNSGIYTTPWLRPTAVTTIAETPRALSARNNSCERPIPAVSAGISRQNATAFEFHKPESLTYMTHYNKKFLNNTCCNNASSSVSLLSSNKENIHVQPERDASSHQRSNTSSSIDNELNSSSIRTISQLYAKYGEAKKVNEEREKMKKSVMTSRLKIEVEEPTKQQLLEKENRVNNGSSSSRSASNTGKIGGRANKVGESIEV